MLKPLLAFLIGSLVLTACDSPNAVSKNSAEKAASSVTNTANATANAANNTLSASNPTTPIKLTADGKILVDWKLVDSGVSAISPSQFKYPFAIDSMPVKNYMNAYHVDAKTAQHNLTIGMATNEAISKILDQINTSYVSHELTAGKGSKLVIHTTSKVVPSEHDYVIEDPFAKGLILPIQLIPDGKKSGTSDNPH